MVKSIRVLVVDDAALVRELLSVGLNLDPNIEIVGTAKDAYEARDKIVELQPDVITLDVEMPKMNGVEFLRKLMPQYPLPVVMVSALTDKGAKITFEALEAGAIDFVSKPKSDVPGGINAMLTELRTKIKIASTANVSHWKHNREIIKSDSNVIKDYSDYLLDKKVISIGASTGGTEAIRKVISKFPVTTPGVLIVQHMPAGFTKSFSERMNSCCLIEVKEAENGDIVTPGKVLIAPGGKHMRILKHNSKYEVEVKIGEPVSGHCPSVDVLMQSMSENVGEYGAGVILTGMGSDGSEGILSMRKSGARTIAQDEESSVVFGMPKQAYIKGGAECYVPLDMVAAKILEMISEKKK